MPRLKQVLTPAQAARRRTARAVAARNARADAALAEVAEDEQAVVRALTEPRPKLRRSETRPERMMNRASR